MKKICTFNLSYHIIKDMNQQIRRGYRSAFVQDAIYEKLERVTSHSLDDYKTSRLLSHVRNFRWTKLTELEKTLLEELIHRLEAEDD